MVHTPPHLLVFSSLFPHSGAPNAGVFIRERMFRVGKTLPITVISPKPWFPGQSLIRYFKPGFRLPAPRHEIQDGITVYHPRYISFPGMLKQLDGFFMAAGSYLIARRLKKQLGIRLLDAHFTYPDGYAATLLGRWLDLPVTITLRGTEVPQSGRDKLRPLLVRAWRGAARLFSVSESLRQHAISLGIDNRKIKVIGNGVDTTKFHPTDRMFVRQSLGIPESAKVIISVGALVERKGFHRVIEILPELFDTYPELHYLIVGGAGPEGDFREGLMRQVKSLQLESRVHFLGAMPSTELKWPLSAADLFVLSTSNEGWANVFLEAMACGLPVVTTDVGGNKEVVCRPELGRIVPFGDATALLESVRSALSGSWDRTAIRKYAMENAWDQRVACLVEEFLTIISDGRKQTPSTHAEIIDK